MKTKNYLVFDFGASNGRAVVARFNGSRFDMDVTHRFDNRPVIATGVLYWDILRLFSELKEGIVASSRKYGALSSLALDAWGADFGLLDRRGRLLANPVHYRDEQRVRVEKKVLSLIPKEKVFNLTGMGITPICDIFQLYAMKTGGDPAFKHAARYLSVADLFNYLLTGKTFNEYTRFTTSALLSQTDKRLVTAICHKLGIPTKIFPPLVRPGKRIGNVTADVAREMNTKSIPVVAIASHDTASAVAGIPVVSKEQNWAFVTLGTWFTVGQETATPLINHEVYTSGFCNEGGVEDRNIFVKNLTGLWVIQQCRAKWNQEQGRDIPWGEVVKESLAAKPLASFIDVEHPSFGQMQADMPSVVREFCRRTGQTVPDGLGAVARCVYDSLAMKTRQCAAMLGSFMGRKVGLLHLVGGGINNRSLCQWLSNACGTPAIAGPTETTSAGNLLMQMKADGEISTLAEGRELCLKSSEVARYEPSDRSAWDDAYGRYQKILA
jgi:sugar (pentulose or hexulose) kinase